MEIASLRSHIENIQRENKKQEGQIEDVLQDKHANEVVISGPNIPVGSDNEKSEEVLDKFLRTHLHINLKKGSITRAYRLGAKKENMPDKRPLCFKVGDEQTKSTLIKTIINSKKGVFINEYLTSYKRKLLTKALQLKKDKRYVTRCFISNGILHVKNSPDARYTKIKTPEELDLYLLGLGVSSATTLYDSLSDN